jgi:hypothetical protein
MHGIKRKGETEEGKKKKHARTGDELGPCFPDEILCLFFHFIQRLQDRLNFRLANQHFRDIAQWQVRQELRELSTRYVCLFFFFFFLFSTLSRRKLVTCYDAFNLGVKLEMGLFECYVTQEGGVTFLSPRGNVRWWQWVWAWEGFDYSFSGSGHLYRAHEAYQLESTFVRDLSVNLCSGSMGRLLCLEESLPVERDEGAIEQYLTLWDEVFMLRQQYRAGSLRIVRDQMAAVLNSMPMQRPSGPFALQADVPSWLADHIKCQPLGRGMWKLVFKSFCCYQNDRGDTLWLLKAPLLSDPVYSITLVSGVKYLHWLPYLTAEGDCYTLQVGDATDHYAESRQHFSWADGSLQETYQHPFPLCVHEFMDGLSIAFSKVYEHPSQDPQFQPFHLAKEAILDFLQSVKEAL